MIPVELNKQKNATNFKVTASSWMTARLTPPLAGSLRRWPDHINLVLWLIATPQADTAVMHLAVNTRAIATVHVAWCETVQPLQTAPQMDADRNTGAAWWAACSSTNHSTATQHYTFMHTLARHTKRELWKQDIPHGKGNCSSLKTAAVFSDILYLKRCRYESVNYFQTRGDKKEEKESPYQTI